MMKEEGWVSELYEQAVGLGSHSLSHCSPVRFNKPHGFWGPRKKKKKTSRFTIGSEDVLSTETS